MGMAIWPCTEPPPPWLPCLLLPLEGSSSSRKGRLSSGEGATVLPNLTPGMGCGWVSLQHLGAVHIFEAWAALVYSVYHYLYSIFGRHRVRCKKHNSPRYKLDI